MRDKHFLLHWLDGTTQDVWGPTIEYACNAAGIGGGAIGALDWWEEISADSSTAKSGWDKTRRESGFYYVCWHGCDSWTVALYEWEPEHKDGVWTVPGDPERYPDNACPFSEGYPLNLSSLQVTDPTPIKKLGRRK